MIIGAGLAGLIAAHAFNREVIFEAAEKPTENHKALLRFRTDAVSRLTGIPFHSVLVRKGIWLDGVYHEPNIQLANAYSQKVLGRILGNRSIWNIEPVTRFIAPDNFYEQMLDHVGDRVRWGVQCDFRTTYDANEPIISTAPLPIAAAACDIGHRQRFDRAPITVARFRLDRAHAYQTVYFPACEHTMYRASITGDLMIVEFAGTPGIIERDDLWMGDLCEAFAIHPEALQPLERVSQKYGKIAPIDEAERRRLVVELTEKFGVYSLGRFATWRNLLLDDVVDDIAVIKKLIHASSYDRKLIGAK